MPLTANWSIENFHFLSLPPYTRGDNCLASGQESTHCIHIKCSLLDVLLVMIHLTFCDSIIYNSAVFGHVAFNFSTSDGLLQSNYFHFNFPIQYTP